MTPIPYESVRSYPSLDYVLVEEPDLTIRDLEGKMVMPASLQRKSNVK